MSTESSPANQMKGRLSRLTLLVWHRLRQPKTTAMLVVLVLVVLLLRWAIPQQATAEMSAAGWIETLPGWLQPWGDLLYGLGFGLLLRSLWFWGAVAALMLSALVGLAASFGPCQRRATEAPADIEWQPALATRAEQLVRLPADPDQYLNRLKSQLRDRGFQIDHIDDEVREVSAAKHRRNWWAIPAIYTGLLLVCLGFLVSRYTVQTEQQQLQPLKATRSELFGGMLLLRQASIETGTLTYTSPTAERQTIQWRQYQPAWLNGAVIIPTNFEPMLSVEVRDAEGELLTLVPPRVDLAADTRLSFPIDAPDVPLYFLVPAADLAVQILPASVLSDNSINIQVKREDEATLSENEMHPVGAAFSVGNLSMTISLDYGLEYVARRDWGLPFYALGGPVVMIGLALLLLRPPWQLWLIPEVKGRGGQLYGVAETFGASPEPVAALLSSLLAANSANDAVNAQPAGSESVVEA